MVLLQVLEFQSTFNPQDQETQFHMDKFSLFLIYNILEWPNTNSQLLIFEYPLFFLLIVQESICEQCSIYPRIEFSEVLFVIHRNSSKFHEYAYFYEIKDS